MSNLIEVLSGANHAPTPGWAYVPDIRQPVTASGRAGGRKRGARDAAISRDEGSSRQQNAVLRRLAELDRDNHKDVHIPIPTKQKDTGSKASRTKTTPNVRRILMSQKTFKNYLDDEEAAAALAPPSGTRPSGRSSKAARKVGARLSAAFQSQSEPKVSQLIVSEFDHDPLLKSYIPAAPSELIMQTLLSEPPLSYNASRATFPTNVSRKPPRVFCGICGYWGKIKCIKCRARVCSLACQQAHDETVCDRFFT
ncbi:hypothetical protein LOZ42_004738 [Ophidiomyces ophidiicola]|nr:hypothetical protein LOZ42_004738 [Ophidiomyces ophidiicola]